MGKAKSNNKNRVGVEKEQLGRPLEILHEISHLLTVGPSLEKILHLILDRIGKRMAVTQLAIWGVDEEDYFYVLAGYNMPKAYLEFSKSKQGRVKKTQGAIGRAYLTKKPYLCKSLTDPYAPPQYVQEILREKIKIGGILCVPLIVRGNSIGVLNFYFPKPRKSVPEAEVKLISIIANQIAGLIENSRIYQKLKTKTKELQEKVEELEGFHRLTVGRELKMIELKEEIEKLKKELEGFHREQIKA